jgi:hypothetical protein
MASRRRSSRRTIPISPDHSRVLRWAQLLFNADFREGKFDDTFRGEFACFTGFSTFLAVKVSSPFFGFAAIFQIRKM